MKRISELWSLILENNTTLFYRSKKAIFLLCIATIASFMLKTTHDGSLVDIIWTNLYIIGPSIIVLLLIIMFYKVSKQKP
jgi:hypothetical protein